MAASFASITRVSDRCFKDVPNSSDEPRLHDKFGDGAEPSGCPMHLRSQAQWPNKQKWSAAGNSSPISTPTKSACGIQRSPDGKHRGIHFAICEPVWLITGSCMTCSPQHK
jgi:hypothetical protein